MERPRIVPKDTLRGVTVGEYAESLGVSRITATRRLKLYRENGHLPMNPRDPRTVDESGLTAHTRQLDFLVEEAVRENPILRNKEIATSLADPEKLGKKVTTITISRSKRRLVESGRLQRSRLQLNEYREVDSQVKELLEKGLSDQEIADKLKQPKRRVTGSAYRSRKEGLAESRKGSLNVDIEQYLRERSGEKINLSEVARKFGVGREWVRQIRNRLKGE